MIRTTNPVLNEQAFQGFDGWSIADEQRGMTLSGTVQRTFVLLMLVVAASSWTWSLAAAGREQAMPWMIGGLIGGLVLALVTTFKQTWSPVTAPLYAIAEGLFLGAVSAMFEAQYKGIVIQAVGLTFGTALVLLATYTSGLIRATENFKLGVVAATGGILLFYLVAMVLRMFGVPVPMIHDSGPIGIAFSAFVVVVAALNLVLDFDFIENGAERGAPRYMEWYGAFGLTVTLIWLYISMLRLLAKLRER